VDLKKASLPKQRCNEVTGLWGERIRKDGAEVCTSVNAGSQRDGHEKKKKKQRGPLWGDHEGQEGDRYYDDRAPAFPKEKENHGLLWSERVTKRKEKNWQGKNARRKKSHNTIFGRRREKK